MGKCLRCGVTVIGGGVKDQGRVFCSETCFRVVSLKELIDSMPEGRFAERVDLLRQAKCPKCGGDGPLDIHSAHEVRSAIIASFPSSKSQLSCTRCARIKQAAGIVVSGLLGWWGFPMGLIMTPVQISRNLVAIIRPTGRKAPSLRMRWLVAGDIRKELLEKAKLAEQERRVSAGDDEGWRRPTG